MGEIYSVCGSYVQDWLLYDTDYNWRVLAKEGGELRAVSDIGTHWMDLVHFITGLEVESLFADLWTVHPIRKRPTGEVETYSAKTTKIVPTEEVKITTDDFGCIMFHFKGGAHGVLWVSQTTAGRKNCLRYELAGSKCALEWISEKPNSLWIGRREKANEELLRDPGLLSDARAAVRQLPRRPQRGLPGHVQALVPHVLRVHPGRLRRRAEGLRHLRGRPPRGGPLRGHHREPQEAGVGEGLRHSI